MKKLNVIVVGAGKQAIEDYIPALEYSSMFNILGVVDPDKSRLKTVLEMFDLEVSTTIKSLLDAHEAYPDVAVVAVPHSAYAHIIKDLAKRKIHIIKEKPFATSMEEALEIKKLIEENEVKLFVTLRRRYNPIFNTFNQLMRHIGDIYSIEGRYTMNIARLDEGWRSRKEMAGGGALIDMGYHFVDLIIWYFGLPDAITCKLSRNNRSDQVYDVEDTALVHFTYNTVRGDEKRILGNMIVSRVYPAKEESLTVYGTKGSVQVQRGRLVRRDINGNEVEVLKREGAWPSAIIDQLEDFGSCIINNLVADRVLREEYIKHIAFIEACYASNNDSVAHNPYNYLKKIVER